MFIFSYKKIRVTLFHIPFWVPSNFPNFPVLANIVLLQQKKNGALFFYQPTFLPSDRVQNSDDIIILFKTQSSLSNTCSWIPCPGPSRSAQTYQLDFSRQEDHLGKSIWPKKLVFRTFPGERSDWKKIFDRRRLWWSFYLSHHDKGRRGVPSRLLRLSQTSYNVCTWWIRILWTSKLGRID